MQASYFYPQTDPFPLKPDSPTANLNSPTTSSNCDINQEDYEYYLNQRSNSI